MADGTLGKLSAAFWILNLFSVHEMQTTAVFGFERVAGRRNKKGRILFYPHLRRMTDSFCL